MAGASFIIKVPESDGVRCTSVFCGTRMASASLFVRERTCMANWQFSVGGDCGVLGWRKRGSLSKTPLVKYSDREGRVRYHSTIKRLG